MADAHDRATLGEALDVLQQLHELGAKLMSIEDAIIRALDGLEGCDGLNNVSLDYAIKQVFRAQDKTKEAFDTYDSLISELRRTVALMLRPRPAGA